ncbi:MAG TPA: glycosyltransferase [Candidatus Eisenbacteria bacterium]
MRAQAERVKVVLAESGTSLGGTERVVWELATRLPDRRFEVEVWLSPAPGVDELAASLAARDIAVRRVPEVDSRWDWRGMLLAWRELRRSAPRLLHVHHVWPAADRYLAAIADAAGVPHLIVTEHIVGWAHSAAQRRLKRRELERADVVTAVCSAVADSLAHDYGVDRARLRVLPNGADPPDLEAERPEARRLRDRFGAALLKPLWVCAARLEEQKGHAVLLDALAEVRRRDHDFVCALAGDGTLREPLARRAAELGLADHVHFLGRLDDVGPLLLAADAVILPSRWEGLPLILLEALARARPVVASAVGGVPDVVEDEVTGRLVPPGDPAALADALEGFHGRPDAALKLGRAGEQRIEEAYTWPRVAEAFELVYDDVLGLASFDASRRGPRAAPLRGAR